MIQQITPDVWQEIIADILKVAGSNLNTEVKKVLSGNLDFIVAILKNKWIYISSNPLGFLTWETIEGWGSFCEGWNLRPIDVAVMYYLRSLHPSLKQIEDIDVPNVLQAENENARIKMIHQHALELSGIDQLLSPDDFDKITSSHQKTKNVIDLHSKWLLEKIKDNPDFLRVCISQGITVLLQSLDNVELLNLVGDQKGLVSILNDNNTFQELLKMPPECVAIICDDDKERHINLFIIPGVSQISLAQWDQFFDTYDNNDRKKQDKIKEFVYRCIAENVEF